MANKDFKGLLNLIAFVAIGLVGVTLILSEIGLSGDISNALALVAHVLAYLITAIAGFYYVKNKNNIWVWIIYAVSIVLIILSYVI